MIVKSSIIILLLLSGVQSFLWANPIDDTPVVKFSELVFDNSNNWTMEITSTFGMKFDSVLFISSLSTAKLKVSYPTNQRIAIISSDSLTTPLLLNREGDKIVIKTYSSIQSVSTIIRTRSDSIIYGNYPSASVGEPASGYSIMRISLEYSGIKMTIDCLSKSPSPGIVNDTLNLSGTLKGYIYDSNNKPVRGLKVFNGLVPCYFVLETPLVIDSNGTYSTKIFQTICSPTKLLVEYQGPWGEEIDTVAIEPFVLKDIHPDTIVIQDIHLKDDRYITSVNNKLSAINDELIMMNYPNPFNLSTNFFVKIPDKLKSTDIEISIINITGQLIKNISLKTGRAAIWDGKDSGGTIMPSGVYFYRLAINKQVMKSGSMILLK